MSNNKWHRAINETLWGAVLAEKFSSKISVMLRTGAIFVLKEKFMTSHLMLESSFI